VGCRRRAGQPSRGRQISSMRRDGDVSGILSEVAENPEPTKILRHQSLDNRGLNKIH